MKFKLPDQLDFLRVGRLPQKSSTERMDDKVILITGATNGIGYVTTRELAAKGAKLILLVRNEEKGKELVKELKNHFNAESFLFIADFEQLDQLSATLDAIISQFPHIDVLINNAGAHRTTKKIGKDGMDAVFTVNHLASFLITQKMIPLLRMSKEARIINVNSEGHRFGNVDMEDLAWEKRIYTGLRSYGASKTAQLHCMYIWKKKLDESGITINSMHPGAVKSNIGNHSGKIYNFYLKYFIGPTLRKPSISANAIYYLASSPDMKGVSGHFYNLTNIEKPAPHAQESKVSQVIFDKTEEILKDVR